MGLLIDGKWHDQWYDTDSTGGRFERSESAFRNWITPDGSPGPSGSGGFAAEPGRYRLYVSLACPWAHRALIFRALKGLESAIPVSVVHWRMKENGWEFRTDDDPSEAVTGDPLFGADFMHQLYTRAKSDYSGRVTVPVLWDEKRETIVSNESAEIIRMLNSAFDDVGARPGDYYPQDLREEIDAINAVVYDRVNNGVYKAGFATRQAAYEEAVTDLFETLDDLEARLGRQRYLAGERQTEADWRLFTTLLRFDPVYVGHFKCNLRRLVDYPNLWAYTRELYQVPGVAETVNFHHIKHHYYGSHDTINPTGVVPLGPLLDLEAPHGRG
ncbi:glutathione S-transferase family protein [Aquibaculum sediminis]|uniref:glutathione S-transferase family protein n=1 Tax=Aquibaculum sediminis TaxID=3231907 RepID=UPI00345552B5